MKTLILGPLDYPSVRADLILMNYKQNVYSIYYTMENLIIYELKKGRNLLNETETALYIASQMTDKEYESSDIFFGLAPKKYHFDRIICYNRITLEAQEAVIKSHYRMFNKEFWSTEDITEDHVDIMEAIKSAQSEPATSD